MEYFRASMSHLRVIYTLHYNTYCLNSVFYCQVLSLEILRLF